MQATLSDVEFAQFRAFAAGGEILHTEVDLTTAELLALFTTPKELVSTPGTKYVHEFISAVLILDYNSAAYATRGDLRVKENDESGTTLSDTIALADLMDNTADTVRTMQALSADVALTAGAALVLTVATGNPVTGDSPLRVRVAYRTYPTGL